MELRILGPIEVWNAGREADIGPGRQRAVLGAMLVDPERPVSLETLVDRVWGDAPPNGVRSVVYTYVARLRRALAQASEGQPELVGLSKSSAGYRLEANPEAVDLYRFRQLVKEGRRSDLADPRRSALLQQALSLWRGDALSGMNGDWASRVSRTLRQLHTEALTQWADVELRLGHCVAVLGELRAALLLDPQSEQLGERLMRALHLDGRSVDALEYYQVLRQHLAQDLGVDPSPRLQALYESILRGEQSGPRPGHAEQAELLAHHPAGVVLRPRMLPLDLPDFTGRAAELRRITPILTRYHVASRAAAPPAILISGAAGMGKTALAVHAAHSVEHEFPDGLLFAGLRGSTRHPADPFSVLGRLLRALGQAPSAVPEDPDERAEVYHALVVNRRLLVVLDDALDDEQVQPLLPGGTDCVTLVTTRNWLGVPPGADVLELAELPEQDGLALLARLIGAQRVEREPAAAVAIVGYCSGLPLAIRAAAARLAARPHRSLSWYEARLSDENRRLDELAHGSLSVRARLASSYDSLPSDARELLRCLGDLPTSEFDGYMACPILGKDFRTVEDACEQLVEAYFLSVVEESAGDQPTRFRLDGLQRAFARGIGEFQAPGVGIPGPFKILSSPSTTSVFDTHGEELTDQRRWTR